MNWYKLFYWVSVADGVKHMFDVLSNICIAIFVCAMIVLVITTFGRANSIASNGLKKGQEDENDEYRSWDQVRHISKLFMIWGVILGVVTWTLSVVIPSKTDALTIIAGGAVGNFITSDSSAKQIPAEAMLLLREKMSQEIRAIRASSIVGSAVDTLKDKTKEELIELIKEKAK